MMLDRFSGFADAVILVWPTVALFCAVGEDAPGLLHPVSQKLLPNFAATSDRSEVREDPINASYRPGRTSSEFARKLVECRMVQRSF